MIFRLRRCCLYCNCFIWIVGFTSFRRHPKIGLTQKLRTACGFIRFYFNCIIWIVGFTSFRRHPRVGAYSSKKFSLASQVGLFYTPALKQASVEPIKKAQHYVQNFLLVPETGFEPARRFQHHHLKVACLPISTPGLKKCNIRKYSLHTFWYFYS